MNRDKECFTNLSGLNRDVISPWDFESTLQDGDLCEPMEDEERKFYIEYIEELDGDLDKNQET
jgi:hypothetical protein